MTRRAFMIGLGAVLAAPRAGEAQQGASVHRISVVAATTSDVSGISGYREGLREHNYIEGRNLLVEWRGRHEPSGPPHRTADEVRTRDQHEDRQGARPDDSTIAAAASRSNYRVTLNLCRPAEEINQCRSSRGSCSV